jgi:hypothetical protein
MIPKYRLNAKQETRPSHHKNEERHHDRMKPEGSHAEASAFFGVFSFLGAAFFGAAFLAAAGLAAVFATRPDLVLVKTVGLSTTAGAAAAWEKLVGC